MEDLLGCSTRNPDPVRQPRRELPGLRTFPSCSIAQVEWGGNAAGADRATMPRGTELIAEGDNPACRFRTAYDVALAPIEVADARFDAVVEVDGARRLPLGVSSKLSLTLRCTRAGAGLAQLGVASLRVFVDGTPAFCAALHDCLFMHAECTYADVPGAARCWMLESVPVSAVGLDAADALVPAQAGEEVDACLLTEYFAFPEKFSFFDIDMGALAAHLPHNASVVTLHFAIVGVAAASAIARTLESLSAAHLLLGCTPVLNLTPAHLCQGMLETAPNRAGYPVRLLRTPTPPRWHRPGADHFSQFSRTLALYGWPQTLACRHEIAGVVGIETRRASVWTHDGHGASLARGTEIRVTVDETGIAECSLHLLAQVLNRFFRVSRLVLVSHQSGNELLHCLPDNAVFA
jgi:type VI protein secretion system component VasA